MRHFVFCHGFGFTHRFWDNLAPLFSAHPCSFVDLGYFGRTITPHISDCQEIIAIGHSLGMLKLAQMYRQVAYLVGLNGFTNFLGNRPDLHERRKRELDRMAQNISRDATRAIESFRVRCGVQEQQSNANLQPLKDDLHFLSKPHDASPALIIAAMDDVVVPPEVIEDNFAHQPRIQVEMLSNGGHALGLNHPQVVFDKIMNFLRSHA